MSGLNIASQAPYRDSDAVPATTKSFASSLHTHSTNGITIGRNSTYVSIYTQSRSKHASLFYLEKVHFEVLASRKFNSGKKKQKKDLLGSN
jgi:hypothetical protein